MIYKKSWKYILIKDNSGLKLFRIKALKDFSNVSKNYIGGYIKGYHNLSQFGNCWIYDNALVTDSAHVSENAQISGNAVVKDNAEISGYADIKDNARVFGVAQVSGNTQVYGNARVKNRATIINNAWVREIDCRYRIFRKNF